MRRRRRSDMVGLAASLALLLGSTTPPAAAQEPGTLPWPGGPHPVGVSGFVVTDADRGDALVPGMEEGRTVKVVLWYPAVRRTGSPPGYLSELEVRRAVLGDHFVDAAAAVRGDARRDAQPSRRDGAFPVVLLSHSLGGLPGLYTALAEGLASRGYLVAAVGHPGGAAAIHVDGRVIPLSPAWGENDPAGAGQDQAFAFREARTRVWVADVLHVLSVLPDRLAGGQRLGDIVDTTRVGYVGHSVGGSAAALGCAIAARLDACVNLDGWPLAEEVREAGLDRPYMHVEETRPYRSPEQLNEWGVDRQRYDRIQAGLDAGRDSLFQAMRAPSYHLVVDGITHEGFSDLPLWSDSDRAAQPLPAERGLGILRVWLGWFLDRHVKGDAAARPPDPARFPEVRFTAYGEDWSQDRPGS